MTKHCFVTVPALRCTFEGTLHRVPDTRLALIHNIGAHLAHHRVLVAGAAAAADGADQLAAFDQRESARIGDQRRIARADIGVAGLT